MLKRIIGGIKIGLFVIKNPDTFTETTFKMLNELLTVLLKVAIEDKPYMTQIMVTVDRDVPQPIVHIWAGAGASSDPIKRIRELIEENDSLKALVKNKV